MSIKEKIIWWFDNNFYSLIIGLFIGCIIGIFVIDSTKNVKNKSISISTKSTFELIKTPQGFDVYKNDSLLYEYTKQNTDSLSLETLNDIWQGE
jgi:hypothetical protein